jgi:hypothetical protein
MSTTFTCKRIANSFRDGEKIIYILNEVTYEGNVYPHTKRVHIALIGELPAILKHIFDAASYVEGGGINSPDGKLTPERYIKSWLNAIKKPFYLRFGKEQRLSMEPVYSWDKEKFEKLRAAIDERGTTPNLINHYDLVSALHAYSTVYQSFTDSGQPCEVEIDASLGYRPKSVRSAVVQEQGKFVHLPFGHGQYYLKIDEQGDSVGPPEWLYAIMGDYIATLSEIELTNPGAYKVLIPALRSRLSSLAQTDPKDITCTLSKPAEDHHAKKEILRLIGCYGMEFNLSSVGEDDIYPLYQHVRHFHIRNECQVDATVNLEVQQQMQTQMDLS